ncbi:hypothetical protein BCR34DRAFT_592037 [Clohesyomyces aquaticus]|uniref:Uncharacterized protein n=1 Tax=Clohesyomyces aquaticus TaxID=1231657 RepID=A0A1Y1YVH2_9PLEO|nr:hypothetical protein BCR34DRAFT_592037 [Clohesyomyces aquaticus]
MNGYPYYPPGACDPRYTYSQNPYGHANSPLPSARHDSNPKNPTTLPYNNEALDYSHYNPRVRDLLHTSSHNRHESSHDCHGSSYGRHGSSRNHQGSSHDRHGSSYDRHDSSHYRHASSHNRHGRANTPSPDTSHHRNSSHSTASRHYTEAGSYSRRGDEYKPRDGTQKASSSRHGRQDAPAIPSQEPTLDPSNFATVLFKDKTGKGQAGFVVKEGAEDLLDGLHKLHDLGMVVTVKEDHTEKFLKAVMKDNEYLNDHEKDGFMCSKNGICIFLHHLPTLYISAPTLTSPEWPNSTSKTSRKIPTTRRQTSK